MIEYNELLKEIRTKAEGFFRSTANEYIPKMYWALRNENQNLTPEDARDRIEKDCVGIWSKRTILDALPDEAKDLKKQKAGRLSQKEANSAAVSAAPEKKEEEEIMIDTQGKPIDNSIQAQTTTKATVADSFQTSHNNEDQLQNNDDDLLHFEFSLPSPDVEKYIFTPPDEWGDKGEDQFWINGVLDKRSGKVISATIGRLSQLE
jgi:hypothetical protein